MVPKLENKGDIEFQGSCKLNGDLNINTAYAISNKGAMAGYMNYLERGNGASSYNSGSFGEKEIAAKSKFGELGYGRYFISDKKSYNYFGGVGFGRHSSKLDDISSDRQVSVGMIEGDFIKIFSQYGVRYLKEKNVDIELFGQSSFSINPIGIQQIGDDLLYQTTEFSSIGTRIRLN